MKQLRLPGVEPRRRGPYKPRELIHPWRLRPASIQREREIADLFRYGYNMAEIGVFYELTRERVRQILKPFGLNGAEGLEKRSVGAAEKRMAKAQARIAARALNAQKYGMSVDDYTRRHGLGMIKAFMRVRTHRQPGTFTIGLVEWCEVWENSGLWHRRGRVSGCYGMTRIDDTKPYEVGNVMIAPNADVIGKYPRGKPRLRGNIRAGETKAKTP